MINSWRLETGVFSPVYVCETTIDAKQRTANALLTLKHCESHTGSPGNRVNTNKAEQRKCWLVDCDDSDRQLQLLLALIGTYASFHVRPEMSTGVVCKVTFVAFFPFYLFAETVALRQNKRFNL
jgi:hypothetical protein